MTHTHCDAGDVVGKILSGSIPTSFVHPDTLIASHRVSEAILFFLFSLSILLCHVAMQLDCHSVKAVRLLRFVLN